MQPSIRMFTCSYNQTWIRERWEREEQEMRLLFCSDITQNAPEKTNSWKKVEPNTYIL